MISLHGFGEKKLLTINYKPFEVCKNYSMFGCKEFAMEI
jgi:hypothetical protein